ncbi:hypothetical protein [Chryseobacterium sp. EO14]|uniref:hypothetical protein n=1 Tax=Chryseobacterium sp. EO14 TaxID=2950551 RepID=UPI00210D357D|nr:hypothetical protein [Chryseobacterium sp. EO14]MCQ4142710.1 hypothetical protein [Chryseobacterium sp. EO14]
MKSDRLIFTIYNQNDIDNPPKYNGELDSVKKELEDSINKLISDFENTHKSIVIFDQVDITNSEKRVELSLLIDLKTLASSSLPQ